MSYAHEGLGLQVVVGSLTRHFPLFLTAPRWQILTLRVYKLEPHY